MFATLFQRVWTCVALIERYGLKRVLMAARESHWGQESPAANVTVAPTFRRYQVFK